MTSGLLTETERMPGGRRKQNFERRRLELVAEPEWIERVSKQAERLGISLSAYIRLAVTRSLESDEASQPASHSKKPRRS